MLKIKLQRIGKRNQPYYRIIVAEAKSKISGKYLDLLGTYNPLTNPHTVKLDLSKYQYWKQKGAQPTDTVRKLAKKI